MKIVPISAPMPMLIDNFGRKIEYLRISVTDRCDFRCFYCIPKGTKGFTQQQELLSLDETLRLARLFSEQGVGRFRLTGGEPLVRSDIGPMIEQMAALPQVEELSLSTNASQLSRYAQTIKDAGIGRINVSLDSLKPDVFRSVTQGGELTQVLEGLMAAKAAGLHPIKINMVVMKGINETEVASMVDFCLEHGFTLRFIETMPMGAGGQAAQDRYISLDTIREELEQRFELEPARMVGSGPATYLKVVGQRLKMGFITPMSQHFCETCNRVRLSSDGTLYLCLGQNDNLQLRPLLRQGCSDEEIKQAITTAINRKPIRHSFNEKPEQVIRMMSKTGG